MDKFLIRKWVLQNAVKYGGHANAGAVIGKLLADDPSLKGQMKVLAKEVQEVIKEVSSLNQEVQLAELKKKWPELLEEKPKAEGPRLKELPGAVQGKVVMRVAPNPSGPLHIGHVLITILNSEYVRKYGGKLILRLEDTNPENIYSPAYAMIEEELNWLTGRNVHELIVQSDRLHVYYDYAQKLINREKAYVCRCDPEVFRKFVVEKMACPCRNLPAREQLMRWDKMFSSYLPGEAVVRIKTDITDPNPAMRDWPALRINHTLHPRTGTEEKVWPLMNFAVAVDDHELGVSHTIRGKEHIDNAKRQQHIADFFGWKPPVHRYIGRINFEGLEVSKTKTRLAVERGEFHGWDDVRLPFLGAFRRRGYQPNAFVRWAVEMGVTETDKTVSMDEFFKTINHFNKEILDPVSKRFSFVWDPVKVTIEGAPSQEVTLHFHPVNELGERKIKTHEKFLLTADDVHQFEDGRLYRLMDCLNFTKEDSKYKFVSKEYTDYKAKGHLIMHWLPDEKNLVKVEVLMPDGTKKEGYGEAAMTQLKVGDIVQLERFGFCRVDKVLDGKIIFCFGHK